MDSDIISFYLYLNTHLDVLIVICFNVKHIFIVPTLILNTSVAIKSIDNSKSISKIA